MQRTFALFAFTAMLAMTAQATAHDHAHGKGPLAASAQSAGFGNTGQAKDISRVVEVDMRDTMRFAPDKLTFNAGETVRLHLRNTGALMHEFVLGTQQEILEHRDMMRTMPTMKHDDANAVSVAPGGTADLIWRFDRSGTFEYACLIPGHWEAGMRGTIAVNTPLQHR